jgi:hypothetical protein
MMVLTPEQRAKLGMELATARQQHADLDASIRALIGASAPDNMLVQRLKKRKLAIKDRIVELEALVLPDIIA